MTITYPLSLPTNPGPAKSSITMENAVAVSESPFTYEQQVYEHQGKRWKLSITLPSTNKIQAAAWVATMAMLNGRKGTFLFGDPDRPTPLGNHGGSPLVNGSSQSGNALVTKGWTHSVTGIMKAGDYFQLGQGANSRLYMVLQDANSDGSGDATLTIWPPLRTSPLDGDTVYISSPVTVFRLDAPFKWDTNQVSTYENITITATEAL